jgi:hypothetical protein
LSRDLELPPTYSIAMVKMAASGILTVAHNAWVGRWQNGEWRRAMDMATRIDQNHGRCIQDTKNIDSLTGRIEESGHHGSTRYGRDRVSTTHLTRLFG